MTYCVRPYRCFFQVVLYFLVITFVISRLDLNLRLDFRVDHSYAMNQASPDPMDHEGEEKSWDDQDLVNKSELMDPLYQSVPKKKGFLFLSYKNLIHPVFSPPPELYQV
jgi:hypothetical protein